LTSIVYSKPLAGFHPAPTLTAPKRLGTNNGFAISEGSSSVKVEWTQPGTNAFDLIKGYVVTIGIPYQPARVYQLRLVSDPTSGEYDASKDPCAPNGTASTCSVTLTFPLTDATGGTLTADGYYGISVATIFRDGHRSDGRCDNGTALGTAAPCSDGTTPAFTAPGVTSTELLIRSRDWPSVFAHEYTVGTPKLHVTQIYVLFTDFSKQEAEFVVWKPYGKSYTFKGALVNGSDAGGGMIAAVDTSGASIQMLVSSAVQFLACPYLDRAQSFPFTAKFFSAYACGVVELHGPYGIPSDILTFAGAKATLQS
jgi:hypothetical protein